MLLEGKGLEGLRPVAAAEEVGAGLAVRGCGDIGSDLHGKAVEGPRQWLGQRQHAGPRVARIGRDACHDSRLHEDLVRGG